MGQQFGQHAGVQAIVENWRQEYNNYRPHSSLDYLTPAEFATRYYENKQAEEATQPLEMAGTLIIGGTKNGGTSSVAAIQNCNACNR